MNFKDRLKKLEAAVDDVINQALSLRGMTTDSEFEDVGYVVDTLSDARFLLTQLIAKKETA